MFSRTVCCAKGCTIWKVRVMPSRALRCGARPVMSSPSKNMRPLSGLMKPDISANSVVLPAPLGPISARRLPRGNARLTSLHGREARRRRRDDPAHGQQGLSHRGLPAGEDAASAGARPCRPRRAAGT